MRMDIGHVRLQEVFVRFHGTLNADGATTSNTLRRSVTSLVITTSLALPSIEITSSTGVVSGRGSGKTTACGRGLSAMGGEKKLPARSRTGALPTGVQHSRLRGTSWHCGEAVAA